MILQAVVNDQVFETMLSNPEGITFTVLFVALLAYTMKTNDTREKNYRETIKSLTDAMNQLDDTKQIATDNKEMTAKIYHEITKKRGNTND